MELDSIKSQLTLLEGYYNDDTKSDDDIIYAVYNWVKRAHVVAQLLLLEGRFPELHRCFDLCRHALQEQHVAGSGRRVLQHATGEDRLLLDSLLVRTAQLERQYEEARVHSKGRDTEYYLNKLLHTNDATGQDGKENGKRAVTPPERGVSFGRRTRLNRWKVPPVLPALVTQTRLFIRSTTDGFADALSDSHAKSCQSSHYLEGFRADVHPTPADGDITMGNSIATPTIAVLPPPPRSPSLVLTSLHTHPTGVEEDGPSGLLASMTAFSSGNDLPISTAPHSLTPPAGEEYLPPLKVAASVKCEVHPRSGRLVRSLSTRVDSAAMSSSSLRHHLLRDSDAIKSALAIKSANNIRCHSTAVMRSLSERATSLVQRTHSQTNPTVETETSIEGIEINKSSQVGTGNSPLSPMTPSFSAAPNTVGQSLPLWGRCYPTDLFPLRGAGEAILPTSTAWVVTGEAVTKRMDFIALGRHNGSTESIEGMSDIASNKCILGDMAVVPGLSLQAKKELKEVFAKYQEGKKELDASRKAMHLKLREHSKIFRQPEVNVKLEDTTVWKRRRKRQATFNDLATTSGASASKLCSHSPVPLLDSESVLQSAEIAGATPATTPTNSRRGGTDIVSDDTYILTFERGAKLDGAKSTEQGSHERSMASHPPSVTPPTVGGKDSWRFFSFNKTVGGVTDTLIGGPASVSTHSSVKGMEASLDAVEQRVQLLESASYVGFPDVHHMVLGRAKVQVEQQRQLTQHEGMPSIISERAFPSFFVDRLHDKESSSAAKANVPPIRRIWTSLHRLRRESTYKLPLSVEDKVFMKHEEEIKNTPGDAVPQPRLYHSVEALRRHVCLLEGDDVTLSMCLPLHLATVRIQRMCRLLASTRERMRRAAAIQDYLRLSETKEAAAVTIQRYIRRLLARRKKLTIQLRLSYLIDQRVAHEMISDEMITSDTVISRKSISGNLPSGPSDSLASMHSPGPSSRQSPDGRWPFSSHMPVKRSVFSPLNMSASWRLYCLPQRGNSALSTRFVRLRRIQENIACRVIVRAFRTYRRRVLQRWERETLSYISFVTKKMNSNEAFDSLVENNASFPVYLGEITSVVGDKLALESSYRDMGSFSVFPLPRDRVMGDVVAAWEARSAKTRRAGDFMTPLEPVRLSELQRVLCERQATAKSQRRRQQELQLEEEEESRRQQRMRMDAVLLLQRYGRGYRALSRLFVRQKGVQEFVETRPRRAELLGDVTSGLVSPRTANNTSSGNLLQIASAKGSGMVSEEYPIPPHVADVIERGIRLSHPMWLGRDEESKEAGLRAIVMVQSFLRWRISLGVLADYLTDLFVRFAQTRWRLRSKWRKELQKKKEKDIVGTLRNVGF